MAVRDKEQRTHERAFESPGVVWRCMRARQGIENVTALLIRAEVYLAFRLIFPEIGVEGFS